MKHYSREMSMEDAKADIFAEYQRLKKVLHDIHDLASACSRPNCGPKSIMKTPLQPSNDIENSASTHAINIHGDRDILGRVKRMSRRSIGQPSQCNDNAKDQPHLPKPNNQCVPPVIRLNIDENIPKRRRKVNQGHVEQPLRRTSRHIRKPDRFAQEYLSILMK